jgi:hypothetical protein
MLTGMSQPPYHPQQPGQQPGQQPPFVPQQPHQQQWAQQQYGGFQPHQRPAQPPKRGAGPLIGIGIGALLVGLLIGTGVMFLVGGGGGGGGDLHASGSDIEVPDEVDSFAQVEEDDVDEDDRLDDRDESESNVSEAHNDASAAIEYYQDDDENTYVVEVVRADTPDPYQYACGEDDSFCQRFDKNDDTTCVYYPDPSSSDDEEDEPEEQLSQCHRSSDGLTVRAWPSGSEGDGGEVESLVNGIFDDVK